jgi:hypothetical protein
LIIVQQSKMTQWIFDHKKAKTDNVNYFFVIFKPGGATPFFKVADDSSSQLGK